jgi:hypothetical protein
MLVSFTFSGRAVAQAGWAVEKTFHVGGDCGWDYVTPDAKMHRLYVPRSTHTMVIDADSGKTIADIPGQGPTGKPMRRGAGVPARGPVEVNRGPRMTSGLVRLIGGCTVYRLGRHRISLRPLSSPSVPDHLYRGAEIEGPKF